VYSTRLHVCTRASLTDNLARILARKSARVGRVGGQVGEDCRAEVGEDVYVGVGPMEFKLNQAPVDGGGRGEVLSTVDRRPSPVNHTQRPALCMWDIGHDSVERVRRR